MRVLLVADGASIHTRRWAAGLRDRGWTVAVASERPCPEPGLEGFSLTPLKRGRVNLGMLSRELRQAVRAFRPDLVHAHYVSHYGLLAALAGVHPLVMSVWGADVEVFPARHALNRMMLSWTLARATAVTASSHYLARVTAPFLPRGRVATVVPFGVDAERFHPGNPPPPTPIRLVSNKHLEPVYGGDLLLEAAKALLPTWPVEVWFLGEGSWRRELADRAERLGLAQRVHWTGQVAPDAVAEILRGAHVAVFPSRRESFGVATLEASASGVAVVASRVGGLPEVVQEGETGLLVPPEDAAALAEALATLIRDPARRQAMGDAGRRWVLDRYTWSQSLDSMIRVYTEVLKTGP
jgi:glycosyltransferase involved in cell wall biosynthesis